MLVISVINNENNRKKKKKQKKQGDGPSYSESARVKWFCCAFKLGFLQLILKVSSILNQI